MGANQQAAKSLLVAEAPGRGGTGFFCDPDALRILEAEVIVPLVESKGERAPIRVWVPGCGKGEDAYTIAILLLERLKAAAGKCGLNLFATDANGDALAIARAGIYGASSLAAVGSQRLEAYLMATRDGRCQVTRQLRAAVTFAVHNVICDIPFAHLDLIVCRNLLGSLEQRHRAGVLDRFHFALNPGGYLMLGPADNPGAAADQFEPIALKGRLCRRVGPSHATLYRIPGLGGAGQGGGAKMPILPTNLSPRMLAVLTQQTLLQRFAPAAVLVNRAGKILYAHGLTARYLEHADRPRSGNVLTVIRADLRARIRNALQTVVATGQPLTVTTQRSDGKNGRTLTRLTVQPIQLAENGEQLQMIAFEDELNPDMRQQCPEQLPAVDGPEVIVEELEIANEELRAVSEEMNCLNEQLQSANEELDASRQEMEALNDALSLTNAQLREQKDVLEAANNDLTNYLNSSDVPTLFLTADLRIKRFTPATSRLLRLLPADIGTPLTAFAQPFLQDLAQDAARVLHDRRSTEREVRVEDQRCYLRRTLPYLTADNRLEGVVVTFTDVSRLKQSENALRDLNEELERRVAERTAELQVANEELRAQVAERERLAAIVESSQDAIIRKTLDGIIVSWNAGAEQLYGYTAQEAIGQSVSMLAPPDRVGESMQVLERLREGQHVDHFKTRRLRKDGREVVVSVSISPVTDATGRVVGASTIARDITEQERLEEMVRLQGEIAAHMAEGVLLVRESDATIVYTNERFDRAFGYAPGELLGKPIVILNAPGDRSPQETAEAILHTLRETGSWKGEVQNIRQDGSRLWSYYSVATLEHPEFGTVWIGVHTDITERKQVESALRESEERLRLGVEATGMGTWFAQVSSPERLECSVRLKEICGLLPEAEVGPELYGALVHPEDRGLVKRAVDKSFDANGTGRFIAEHRVCRPDGTVRWVLAWGQNVFDGPQSARRLAFSTGVVLDITEHKRTELALRESREKLRAILNGATDAIISIDERGLIESVNPAAEKMFGYSAQEMLGQNVNLLMPSPYREEHDCYLAKYRRTHIKHIIGTGREVRGRRKDGSTFPLELSVSEVAHLGLFAGILRDISHRKELEREVLEVATLEHRRIGQELHDSTGQELTALGLLADGLVETMQDQCPAAAALAAKIAAGLQRALSEVRAIARGLVSVEVDAAGLMAALAELATRTGGVQGVQCRLNCSQPVLVEDNQTARHLYRIAQEAVANALRHSRAQQIIISLEGDRRSLALRVRDDGIGLSNGEGNGPGMGLKIMRYRAGLINARLMVERATPAGTLVTCALERDGAHDQE